jgi:hypothetical protein
MKDRIQKKKRRPDNRMGWILQAEELRTAKQHYYMDYEIASECYIPGVVNYQNDFLTIRLLTFKLKDNLFSYNLRLKFPQNIAPFDYNSVSRKGYCFKAGVIGELVSLLSVYYRCRFYLISSTHIDSRSHSPSTKNYHRFTYLRCNPEIHPPIFDGKGKNLSIGFDVFLNSLKSMDVIYHQQFILSCYHYLRSLREVGKDHEMVYIRLVSAIEALSSKFTELRKKDDILREKNINTLIIESQLCREEKTELKKAFENRKAKLKFIRFTEEHCKGFFKGGNYKARKAKIYRADLERILKAIYDARSAYLHRGIPMYLTYPPRIIGKKWDMDTSRGMIIDRRRFPESRKLPFAYWFEGLVCHCILNFVKSKAQSFNP